MKATNQVYVAPVIPVAKIYKPKLEVTNVWVENEEGVWYLVLSTADEKINKYRLDFYES